MASNRKTCHRRSKNGRSASTFSQYRRIVGALRSRWQSSYDLRMLGIYQAPARIKELKDRYGFVIESDGRISIIDAYGFPHDNIAVYVLISEPHPLPDWMCDSWINKAVSKKKPEK